MATGLSSPLGVAGIILIIVGIIMAVIGIILLIANQNREKPWYIWFLLIMGVVLGIIGGILLAVALSQPVATVEVTHNVRQSVAQPAQQLVVNPAPVMTSSPVVANVPQTAQYVVQSPTRQVVTTRQVVSPTVPTRVVGSGTTYIDDDTYDPDPQTIVTQSPGQRRRMMATGPYGPGGSQMTVSGTYKPQTQVNYVTHDIGEHPVTVVG